MWTAGLPQGRSQKRGRQCRKGASSAEVAGKAGVKEGEIWKVMVSSRALQGKRQCMLGKSRGGEPRCILGSLRLE